MAHKSKHEMCLILIDFLINKIQAKFERNQGPK